MLDGWLSVADVADLANLKPTTIYSYLHTHKMPPPDSRVGQSPVWHRETIENWISERNRRIESWFRDRGRRK